MDKSNELLIKFSSKSDLEMFITFLEMYGVSEENGDKVDLENNIIIINSEIDGE